MLRSLVQIESPSGDAAALARFLDLLTGYCEDLARVTFEGQSLIAELDLPGSEPQGQVLLVAHSDTVWPMGTLAEMPWRETADRWFGPGVLDIKAGIVIALQAARILRESGTKVRRRVTLLVVPDEETGSKTSRPLTERLARDSDLVLVLEPGTGLEGKLKTARKGIADYRIRVQGVASHSGVDFEKGASAIVELARQVPILAGLSGPGMSGEGVTVNPGVIRGGTRTNVVAAEAELLVDVRVPTLAAFEAIDARIRGLQPYDPRCRIEVSGQLNRPPMERTPAIAQWFETARTLALGLGVQLEESSTGGGSDGNFTAALGIPTLDGLGAVGEGAHAPHESVLHARLPDRIALLAKLLAAA